MSVYEEVQTEVAYQENKWGHKTDDTVNTPWMWVAYIAAYATKWMSGSFAPIGSPGVDAFRRGMVKVAAIAVSAVQSIDRQRAEQGKTFYE